MAQRKPRIEIKDLPKDMKVTREEMRKVMGGIGTWPTPERPLYYSSGAILPTSLVSKYSQSGGSCGCGCG